MSLKDVSWKYRYQSLRHDIINDFYVPAIKNSRSYKRITGYFSSSFLENLVEEIEHSILENDFYIQILCSPHMSSSDKNDIKIGYELREYYYASIDNVIQHMANDSNTLAIISKLIAKKALDIKFVTTEFDTGIFHAKEGIFTDKNDNKIAFAGSNNETNNALHYNYESFLVLKNWDNPEIVNSIENSFNDIWNNRIDSLEIIEVTSKIEESVNNKLNINTKENKINPYAPIDIEKIYDLYPYQIDAVNAWVNNNFQGLFEMATGTGKTVTALAAYSTLAKLKKKLVTIIVVPQNELLFQWKQDIVNANGTAIICNSDNKDWERKLNIRLRRLALEELGFLNVIVINSTFSKSRFINLLSKYPIEYLIISDEVHSFGSSSLRQMFPKIKEIFPYRLGISATPFRKESHETIALISFFDSIVYQFTLKEAIEAKYLNNYVYVPEVMYFEEEALESYRNFYKENKEKILSKDFKIMTEIEKLTSTIANSSTAKVEKLINDFNLKPSNFHSIVYCSPGGYNNTLQKFDERHIDFVAKKLSEIESVKLRKVRSQVSPEERQDILSQFKNNVLNVLVAIKCLDQGINLPNVTDAYILSSTDSETEFIQRRGRILRTHEGKDTSVIYDYIMLPQDYNNLSFLPDESDSYLVSRELRRMKAYSEGADNERDILSLIDKIKHAYREVLEEI